MAPLFSGTLHLLMALQAGQATLTGTVSDADTGAPLSAAEVVLADLDRVVFTDDFGRYTVRGVPAGPQHLSVRLIGYAQRTLHALVPAAGLLEINLSLPPEPIPLSRLTVRPRVMVRGTEDEHSFASLERGVSIAAVRNHPQLAEPDVLQALAGGDVMLKPESPNGVHVRGGAADQTAYVLDGIPVFNPYHAAVLFSAWNPDAISSVALASAFPSPLLPDVLGGVVAADTRTPGAHTRVQGSVSTTQARVSADGPLGIARAGYLLSLRSSYPGIIAPRNEASYLRGESGDIIAKLEAATLGGHIRLLAHESEDEIDTAASIETDAHDPERNTFEWHSRSLGAVYVRDGSSIDLRVQVWRATSGADAGWLLQSGATASMSAGREDNGVLISLEKHGAAATTSAGLRAVQSRTSYQLATEADGVPRWELHSRTPTGVAFVEHARTLTEATRVQFVTTLTAGAGDVYLGPRAQFGWTLADRLALTASIARLHQFTQSLRNAESIVGNIFPVELHAGAGANAVPVARSDLGVFAAVYRPVAGVRLGVQAYERRSRGLLLVAPRDDEPFATTDFTIGSAASHGFGLDVAISAARYGLVGSYGWQRTRLRYAESSYVPDWAAAHAVDAGIIIFPTATWSIRVGATGALGRRATTVSGAFEWEACNLLDAGCEFAGSPRLGAEPIGAASLPAYFRLDVGMRKHWHLDVVGRDASIALFGTITNLFARSNVLNYAMDPETEERVPVEMRPRSPLVVGLDCRF